MLLGTLGIRKSVVVGGIAMLALVAISLPGEAGVKPGDFITPDNSAQVKDLVSPGVFYRVQHGMTMKIVPTVRVDWPPPYKDATEKYSSQVQLSKDHRTVVGYVAGQPFPLIDANDPDVATKVVWNNVFRPIQSDDYDLRYFDCDTVYSGYNKPFFEVAYGQLGHYAGYDLVGRTEVEPLPTDPDFKKTNRLWLFLLGPELAPQDARGTSLLRYRYAEPTSRRRYLDLDHRRAAPAPSERGDQFERDRRADLGSRSLFGLQSQDRAVRLQVPRREGDARDS